VGGSKEKISNFSTRRSQAYEETEQKGIFNRLYNEDKRLKEKRERLIE
jgi:hypothetical protein